MTSNHLFLYTFSQNQGISFSFVHKHIQYYTRLDNDLLLESVTAGINAHIMDSVHVTHSDRNIT